MEHPGQEDGAIRNVFKTEIGLPNETERSGNLQGVMALPYPRVSSVPLIMFRGVRYHPPRDRLFASPLRGAVHLDLATYQEAPFTFRRTPTC